MRYSESDGIFRLEVRTEEDLWYISLLIKNGDLIMADVMRRVERNADSIRNKKTEREKVSVTIKVEDVQFEEISARIHFIGVIVGGAEDLLGEHQSLNVEEGDFITVIPSDPTLFKKDLKETEQLKEESVLVLSTSDESISLYNVDESRNSIEWKIETPHGKMYKSQDDKYLDKLISYLNPFSKNEIYIIGPSLFRDSISKTLSKLGFKIINTQVSGSDDEGIRELLQGDVLNLRRSAESRLVSEFLKRIQGETSLYGIKRIGEALEMKAVEVLIMTDKFFREKNSSFFLEKCKEGSCKPFIVHSSWETGKIIASYGGITCLLRYKLPS